MWYPFCFLHTWCLWYFKISMWSFNFWYNGCLWRVFCYFLWSPYYLVYVDCCGVRTIVIPPPGCRHVILLLAHWISVVSAPSSHNICHGSLSSSCPLLLWCSSYLAHCVYVVSFLLHARWASFVSFLFFCTQGVCGTLLLLAHCVLWYPFYYVLLAHWVSVVSFLLLAHWVSVLSFLICAHWVSVVSFLFLEHLSVCVGPSTIGLFRAAFPLDLYHSHLRCTFHCTNISFRIFLIFKHETVRKLKPGRWLLFIYTYIYFPAGKPDQIPPNGWHH